MSLYSALTFLSLVLVSTYAYKIAANNDADGGAARNALFHPGFSSGNFGRFFSPDGPLASVYALFNGLSPDQKKAFFDIVTNQSLSMNETKSQLDTWAFNNNKVEEFQNVSSAFEKKKAEFQSQIDSAIANATNLNQAELDIVKEFKDLITNQDLPRGDIKDQLRAKWGNLTEEQRQHFQQAFAPIINQIKAKFSAFHGGFGGFGGGKGFSGFGQWNQGSIRDHFNQLRQRFGNSNGLSDLAALVRPQAGGTEHSLPAIFANFAGRGAQNGNNGHNRNHHNGNGNGGSGGHRNRHQNNINNNPDHGVDA